MTVPIFVVQSVSRALAGAVAGPAGQGMALTAIADVLGLVEFTNLKNRLELGTARPSDVFAVTLAMETAILGAGLILGVATPVVGMIAVTSAAIWVAYDRDPASIQDTVDILLKGGQPWDFLPEILDSA